VRVAPRRRAVTAGEGAATVAVAQRPALLAGDESAGGPDVDVNAQLVEQDTGEGAVTGQQVDEAQVDGWSWSSR